MQQKQFKNRFLSTSPSFPLPDVCLSLPVMVMEARALLSRTWTEQLFLASFADALEGASEAAAGVLFCLYSGTEIYL